MLVIDYLSPRVQHRLIVFIMGCSLLQRLWIKWLVIAWIMVYTFF